MSLKAPCGQDATIKHFKTCTHPECAARQAEFDRMKAETAAMFKKILKPRKESPCDAS